MNKIPVRHIAENRNELPAMEKFSIRSIEELLNGHDLFHDLHRHDFFFLLLVQDGRGSHKIDFVEYPVSGHAVFLLRPGQVHELMLKAGATGYLVEFNAAFYQPKENSLAQRFKKASSKNFCKTEDKRFEKLYILLTFIFQEYTEKAEGYRDAIHANMDLFFIELVRQSEQPQVITNTVSSYTQERFEEFRELVEKNITTNKQVAHYTGLMNLSAYQLNEITRAAVGKTAAEMIDEYILLEAKRYLLATSNQVKEIADLLGYEDTSYFIRFFKKHSGHSPEAFRQQFK